MNNKISDVIRRLEEIKAERGDLPVEASTQDGAAYDVDADAIQFQSWIDKNGVEHKIVWIE